MPVGLIHTGALLQKVNWNGRCYSSAPSPTFCTFSLNGARRDETWEVGRPSACPQVCHSGDVKALGAMFSANLKVEETITSPFPNPTFIPGFSEGYRKRVHDFLHSLSVLMHMDVFQLSICTKVLDLTCFVWHRQTSHYFCTRLIRTSGVSYLFQLCNWVRFKAFLFF